MEKLSGKLNTTLRSQAEVYINGAVFSLKTKGKKKDFPLEKGLTQLGP